MVGTLDLHANVSQAMVRATDVLLAYRTNPHLDQRERGVEAARLMARMLRGDVHPTQAIARPPLVINIERQATGSSPCRECYEALDDMLDDRRVLSNSLLLGFPYADVAEMGASVIVVTNDEPQLAERLAGEFADYLVQHRNSFVGLLIGIDEASSKLRVAGARMPVGHGRQCRRRIPGDGTLLLHAICRRGIRKAFVCLYDPASAAQAAAAGIGAQIEMQLGGKTDQLHGEALRTTARVRSLHSGRFSEDKARHGGRRHYDMGPTAVVGLDLGPTVMLVSRRIAPFSLEQLTSCGVNPADFQAIIAKGVHAPVAAYAPVCPTLLRVNTPGATTADIAQLSYVNRRRPLFPFETI